MMLAWAVSLVAAFLIGVVYERGRGGTTPGGSNGEGERVSRAAL